jgi:hypothetical protein
MTQIGEVKTGADHLAALRDGREVYIDGELVPDVTTHRPSAMPCIPPPRSTTIRPGPRTSSA